MGGGGAYVKIRDQIINVAIIRNGSSEDPSAALNLRTN